MEEKDFSHTLESLSERIGEENEEKGGEAGEKKEEKGGEAGEENEEKGGEAGEKNEEERRVLLFFERQEKLLKGEKSCLMERVKVLEEMERKLVEARERSTDCAKLYESLCNVWDTLKESIQRILQDTNSSKKPLPETILSIFASLVQLIKPLAQSSDKLLANRVKNNMPKVRNDIDKKFSKLFSQELVSQLKQMLSSVEQN